MDDAQIGERSDSPKETAGSDRVRPDAARVGAVRKRLEDARRELLDLSARNRVISTARTSTRSGRLEVVGELSEEIFRILVLEQKAMSFLSGKEPTAAGEDTTDPESLGLAQPDGDGEEDGPAAHHTDRNLQTSLTSEVLQRRLLKLYYDARTFEEEQGVNILYLALGFLKWYEDDRSEKERYAPLLLVPVKLVRRTAGSRFRIQYTDDDITTNVSLQAKLRADFRLELPDVPETDDLAPLAYFEKVAQAVSTKSRWQVLPNDIVLWFYSFSKYLMYRDLEPGSWPDERTLEGHPIVLGLLSDGVGGDPPIWSGEENLDDILHPRDMFHVVDADSSQAMAIEEVRQGRNLVIQGPPGTGKSQTISNLIAAAVKEGKKVLFVSEKMAALEVVKRRLEEIGLGDMCLELHSHKANKRAVLEELERTLFLGRPKTAGIAEQADELARHRDLLNRHAKILHTPLLPCPSTPYSAIGQLVRLQAAGIGAVDFSLEDAVSWSSRELRRNRGLVEEVATSLAAIGNPAKHVWRGVRRTSFLPADIQRTLARIDPLVKLLDQLIWATNTLAEMVNFGSAKSFRDAAAVAQFAKRLTQAPPLDRQSLDEEVWRKRLHDIKALVVEGQRLATCREKLDGVVLEVGWSTDVNTARRDIAAYGHSWLRVLNRRFRGATVTLRGILVDRSLGSVNDRLNILDALIAGQKAVRNLDAPDSQELGRAAFGIDWRGADSDWSALTRICHWVEEFQHANLPQSFGQVLAKLDDRGLDSCREILRRIRLKSLAEEIRQLFADLDLDSAAAFGKRDHLAISMAELRKRLADWQTAGESLSKWIAYFMRWQRLRPAGMRELADRIHAGATPREDAVHYFDMAYNEAVIREAARRHPELERFDGASHEKILQRFKDLDEERIKLARQEVALSHFEGIPTIEGTAGEVGTLRREIKKKRRHMPVRRLLVKAGYAVQAIKPVFMMSPLSIAQFLQPGVLEFDLLLIDEASQVQPVDALGAIARSRQVVVVGDEQQLPPTTFFNRIASVDNSAAAENGEDYSTGDLESILGLCQSQGMRRRMLNWHYRSRHHSLIAVSNHLFYEDRLNVVPNPYNRMPSRGVHPRPVKGVYDRSRSRTNRIEAQEVADAVMKHARETPDESLGVGTFSVAQRDAVLHQLDDRRRRSPELESFFANDKPEPFFVKNLENIQGDERNVIFISVGYARDADKYPKSMTSFGPLNKDGGERRLNVLITRARERCEVFASITADDIDLRRTQAPGVTALKTYLAYAATGQLDTIGLPTDREPDSDFELEVARAVSAHGYQLDAQVGVAGFFVDLAVRDPDVPGRYLLGVECDGASYHSALWARDRDRLRQQVLEERGWRIHRIWSTDWFRRPRDELKKVLVAIENAKVAWAAHDRADHSENTDDREGENEANDDTSDLERDQPVGDAHTVGPVAMVVPYKEAAITVPSGYEIHELRPEALATVVRQIVQIEGPIHKDEIARRVTFLWGLKRTGRRIAESVQVAIAAAEQFGQINRFGCFLSPPDQTDPPIRDRSSVLSTSLRKVDYLPPAEIRVALQAVVEAHIGITPAEASIEVARLLGFRSTSVQLRELIRREAEGLVQTGVLEKRDNKLRSAPARILPLVRAQNV